MSCPPPRVVHQRFYALSVRAPDAVALDGAEGSVTYRQLAERAQKIGRLLVEHGVAPGDTVAVAIDRSVNVIASFLGILSAGAIYCPLDLNQPAERIHFLLNDAKPAVVLTSRAVADRLPASARMLCVEDAEQLAQNELEIIDRVHPRGLACLLYTSGSTGIPKGVLIPQGGIVRLVTESDYIPFNSELRFLFHSQLAFDASTLEIFGPLLNGGTCVLLPGQGIPTLHEIRKAIGAYRVNTLYFGPALYNLMIEESPDTLEGIKHLILGGEAISPSHARRGLDLYPQMQLVNGYGPTEATTFATAYQVPRDTPMDARSVPIGKPIAETQAYIFDENGKLITDDQPGELFLGGIGVAHGYLNRPELTAQRFVPDRFSSDPNARLYRTGDLCRWLPDGNLDFINRMDFQVKIRGQRVEPGEIEAAMREHPAIGQCIVIARGEAADKYLVGFYTVHRGQNCSTGELRKHLQQRLPTYLVPEKLMVLENMPATRNGKVDRRALPEDNVVIMSSSARQPASPLEKDLADLWKQSLRVEQIGLDDCFFEMGGSSLGMMRLCTQIQQRTNRFISVNTFLSATTVEKMADVLSRPAESNHSSLLVTLKAGEGEPLFCIPGHGGHPLLYLPLSQHLQWPGPVIGLQFPGLDEATSPAHSVEEMARQFITEIRHAMPGRRYHLLGYSFGGVVAFEMARQLLSYGEAVGSTILLDAFTAAAGRPRPLMQRLGIHARRLFQKGARHHFQRFNKSRSNREIAAASVKVMPRGQRVNQLNDQAYKAYRPGIYDGDITIIQAAELPEWIEFLVLDRSGGWVDFVRGKLDIKQTSGNHLTMMDQKHVKRLAEILRQCLEAQTLVTA